MAIILGNSSFLDPVYIIPFYIRKRYGYIIPFLPTVYNGSLSSPASNEDDFIRKHYSIYIIPFSYEKISIPFLYGYGLV